MPLFYALIARQQVVLTEHTNLAGNFQTFTRVILKKVPTTQDAQLFMHHNNPDGSTFHFHIRVSRGITYLCMADPDIKTSVGQLFLSDIERQFVSQYGDSVNTAIAFAMNEFARKLSDCMDHYNSGNVTSESEKALMQIDEAKKKMVENVNKSLLRGEKIDLLVDRTDRLQGKAFEFERQSKKLRCEMWALNMKSTIMAILVFLLVAYLALGFACGFTLERCIAAVETPVQIASKMTSDGQVPPPTGTVEQTPLGDFFSW